MTDAVLAPAFPHRPAPRGRLAGPALAALAVLLLAAALPAPERPGPDPTPVEEWHGNVASFAAAPSR